MIVFMYNIDKSILDGGDRLEIHQLEYVVAVEKYRSFSLAAEEICVAQSTLSHQIKKLEEELGVKIFERTTRSIQPTPAGAQFLSIVKQILGELRRARQLMEEFNNLERGYLVIGTLPNIGYLGLTSLIASFAKRYPGIQLELRDGNSDQLMKWLQDSDIDAALLTHTFDENQHKSIQFYPLIHDEFVLIVSKNHPLAGREIIHLGEAAEEKFLATKASQGVRNIFVQACRNAGFEPNIIFESDNLETICGLVAEGLGVALLSTKVVHYLPRPNLSILRLHTKIGRTTALAIPSEPFSPAVVNLFRDFTLRWIQENGSKG